MTLENLNLPVVVICGATGTGKSKLAIEIAKYYNGEVINADALQIYKGMDIATNKVTVEECDGVRHHMLGFESQERLDYTVHDFQEAALNTIYELKKNNKMPVLVGGTNYYIESVLWNKLVDVDGSLSGCIIEKLNALSNLELHEYLDTLDSNSAVLLHPNSRRKVMRAIEISLNSSISQHTHLELQVTKRRFALNDIVFIWVDSDKECLFPRLEKRVDYMVANGLLHELEEMQQLFLRVCPSKTYTRGIFQAIGFKEFHDYLNCPEKELHNREKILTECIERLKIANKQYVRVQNKWIKNRFLKQNSDDINIPLFRVDSSDVSQWHQNVLQPSLNIVDQIIHSSAEKHYSAFVNQLKIVPESLTLQEVHTPCNKVCQTCNNQQFVTLQSWNAHIKGRKHEHMRKRLRRINTIK